MDVRLPDGTIIRNVPEGTTRAQLVERLKRNGYDTSSLTATEEPERTFGGYAKEAFKGLIPGAVSGLETAITGAAALLPEEAEQAVRRGVSRVTEPVREAFAPAPGYEDTTVRKLGEAVGSTAPFLGAGLLGAAGRAAALGLGVATGAGEARQRAEQEEATEGERAAATLLGAPVGALEALPPVRILRRFGFADEAIEEVAGVAPALRRVAQAGGEEALQEASTQVLQNLIAKGVYKPDEAVFGGVGEAAALGGGAGAIIGAIAELALGRRLRGAEPPSEDQEEGITEEPTPPVTPAAGTGAEPTQRAPIAPSEQMELPLDAEAVQIPMFGEEEAADPTPSLYRPAEDALSDLKPRSRAYKEEARNLGLKLDRKGNVKPNQFVFEQPETEVPITQGRFEFEVPQEQPDLPMYVPPTEGQMDMFGTPMPRGGEMPTVPTAAEMPVVEEVPEEQYAFNLPGVPMERLTPRDRVLRAMAISEDKKNIPNLRFATDLRPMELQKTLGDLKKENAIKFNKQTNEWELTPAGAERVRSIGEDVGTPGVGGRTDVPVSPSGTKASATTGVGERGLADVGAPPELPDAREGTDTPALDRMAIIRRAQEKRTAAATRPVDQVSTLRTRAIDAFDNDEINEKTYLAVTDELKKPVPNIARATSLLEGTAKPKREKNVGLDLNRANVFKAQPRIAKETKQFLIKDRGDRDAITQIADLMLKNSPSESESLGYADDYLDPLDASKETIKSKPGVNARRMAKMLGPQLYGDPSDMGVVTIKEILQNSFDSIKGMIDNGELTKGKIDIDVDPDNRIIEMTDNGRGMTPQLLGTKFLEIAGTGKDAKTPSGGFGIAKMLFLYGNKGIRVTTMRDGKVAEMLTDGEQLFDALENPELAPNILVRAPTEEDLQKFPDGHGTNIALTIPENFNDPTTGEVKDIRMVQYEGSVKPLMKSPLFADIDVSFRNKRYGEYRDSIPIGSSFPYNNYTQFTNVKFPWGTARVYVAPSEETYGDNLHVLSNGLYQFSQKVSKDPLDIWSNPVPFQFYVDIKPTVKPEDPGYPFTFNRKDFTEQAKKDYGKIMSYINALYAYQDISNSASSFGSIQYFDGPNKLSAPIEVKPTVPPATTTFAGIQQGDNVTVEDGKLFVRGKELPELTPDQLRAGIPKADQLKVDPKLIDSNRVMMHDNMKLAGSEQSFSDYMRQEHGRAFDLFMYEIGDVFKDLRNEVVDVIGYNDLANEAVGLSFDKEYRGVSIRVPFSGSFINPFATRSINDLEAAYGTFGTMIHELAHHKVRSHNADFPAEMQFIEYKLQAANKLKFDAYQNRLINAFRQYQDVFEKGWRLVNESGSIEARGDHFKDGSREDASRTADEGVPSGKRGPSGKGRAGERVQPSTEQSRAVAGEGRPTAERRTSDEKTTGFGKSVANVYDPFDDAARYSRSPQEQRKGDRAFINSVGKIPTGFPAATQETYDNAVGAVSNLPSSMRVAMFSLLNPHELDRMYAKKAKTKAFENYWNDLNREGVALRDAQDTIMENMTKWQKVKEKYTPAEWNRISRLFMDTTVTKQTVKTKNKKGEETEKGIVGVEVLNFADPSRNVNWKADVNHPLYAQFKALKPDVQNVYKELRLAYIDYQQAIEKQLQQYLTPNEWQKMQYRLNENRIRVYLPLFRQGEFKLRYTDKDGETVVEQFESSNQRSRAWRDAQKDGADPNSVEFSRAGDKAKTALPSTGFFGDVVASLKKSGVKEDAIYPIIEAYLDYLPANSILQRGRKREGYGGYIVDPFQAYANVADNFARRVINMEYAPKFKAHQEQLKLDTTLAVNAGALDPELAEDINIAMDKHVAYVQDPNLNNWASKLGYFSYAMYLGANISTAIVNTLDIPTVTLSRLGGKHGFGKASSALFKAGGEFFRTKKSKEMQELLTRGLDMGSLREHQLRDIEEFKDIDSKWLRAKAGVERILNWAFAKSDMFNRQTTLMAAYNLAKKTPEGTFDEKAFEEAQRAVYDVYGSSFPKAGPPIMQNGFAKTALTFKRFAITRMHLLGNAFYEAAKGENSEVRNMARKELLGHFGTAFVFAGAQGMPLVGGGLALASLLNAMFGDDDEPYNPDFALREAVGLMAYKGPVNYYFSVDIASRTGWTGMFWREDPKRMAEVGPVTYVMEQLLGPAYSYAVGVPRAFDYFGDQQYMRAFEQLAPRAAGNVVKAYRYATEGAYTAKGLPLVDDTTRYNEFMQIFGFRPTEIAEAGDIAGATKRMESKILDRRNAIITRAVVAQMSGDQEGFQKALDDARAFSSKYPARGITFDTLYGAIQRRQKRIIESVNGVTLDPKLARSIYEELGIEQGR